MRSSNAPAPSRREAPPPRRARRRRRFDHRSGRLAHRDHHTSAAQLGRTTLARSRLHRLRRVKATLATIAGAHLPIISACLPTRSGSRRRSRRPAEARGPLTRRPAAGRSSRARGWRSRPRRGRPVLASRRPASFTVTAPRLGRDLDEARGRARSARHDGDERRASSTRGRRSLRSPRGAEGSTRAEAM